MITRWYRTGVFYSVDSVMLAETNVSDDEPREYFGQADSTATRVLVVFAFRLNQAMGAVAGPPGQVSGRRRTIGGLPWTRSSLRGGSEV
jgi:hypothetical protein